MEKTVDLKNIQILCSQHRTVPSCLVLGKTKDGKYVHVCCSSDGNYVWMITAYVPDAKSWNETFDERKSKNGENYGE